MGKLFRVTGLACAAGLAMASAAGAAPGDITLLSGGGGPGHGGDGGPAVDAQLTFPEDCATGPGGVVYVAEDARVRRIGTDGVITTFAGGGPVGAIGEDGSLATGAHIRPAALAVDAAGTVYVADFGLSRILAIAPDGTMRRIAGLGDKVGDTADGGPATDAAIGQPLSLALGRDALFFSSNAGAVRRVDLASLTISSVPQLIGSGGTPGNFELAVGPDGELYASQVNAHTVVAIGTDGQVRPVAGTGTAGFSGDGGPATAATLDRPVALEVDAAGSVFVSDGGNSRIRRIDPAGTITTIAGTGVEGISGDGGPATAATFVFPRGLGVDPAGALCIADTGGVVRSIEAAAAPTPLLDVPALPGPTANLAATGSDRIVLLAALALVTGGLLAVLIARFTRLRPRAREC